MSRLYRGKRDYGSSTILRVSLVGADTAAKILKEFEFKIRRRIVTAAVRAGCNVIKKVAQSMAPIDSGQLRKQLRVSINMDRVSGKVVGKIRPKRTKGQVAKWYSGKSGNNDRSRVIHLVTGGTKPHKVPGAVIAGQYYTRVEHPGSRAQPFMEAAANSAMSAALLAFDAKMDERIAKEAAKLRATQ